MGNPWPQFSAINSASLPDRIGEIIRDAIVSGHLKPGDQVVESRMAKQMGVGQNAVREALQELEFQGFVMKVPNRGTFVTKLSRGNIDEIYRMRMELEALAVYWARENNRPTSADLAQLNAHLDASAKAAKAKDLSGYARADTKFHRYLWKMAGNSYLEKCLELVAVPQLSYVLIESHGQLKLDLNTLVKQHREWLDEIRTKAPRAAYIYTRNLISSFWGQVGGAINQSPNPAEE